MKMELYIEASGRKIRGMAMVFRYGLMVRSTKVDGETTRLMGRENSGTLMVMCLTAAGKKTRRTEREYTFTLMEPNMMESG